MAESTRSSISSDDESWRITTMVAIDKDKNSTYAVQWAVESIKGKDNRLALVHVVNNNANLINNNNNNNSHSRTFSFSSRIASKEGHPLTAEEVTQLFLSYRGYCGRKGVWTKEVILHDLDVVKALGKFITTHGVTKAFFGAPTRNALARAFKNPDIPSCMGKVVPEACSIFVVAKGRSLKIKVGTASEPGTPTGESKSKASNSFFAPNGIRSAPQHSSQDGSDQPRRPSASSMTSRNMMNNNRRVEWQFSSNAPSPQNSVTSFKSKNPTPGESPSRSFESIPLGSSTYSSPVFHSVSGENEVGVSNPFNRHQGNKMSSVVKSVQNLRILTKENLPNLSMSGASDHSDHMHSFHSNSMELLDPSRRHLDSSRNSTSSLTDNIFQELDEELKRLKQELTQITKKYNVACQEAATAREKLDLTAKVGNLDDAKHTQDVAMLVVEMEREKSKAAVEMATKAQRIAELESEKRQRAEEMFKLESQEKQRAINALTHSAIQYRKYSIDEIENATQYFSNSEKIGEGGYGPVYKAILDHTSVAIKVLRPDISEGHIQFQREVDVLGRMRHPHMVILLGACPEYGCLIYEYMENGSLEDRLFCRSDSPPLPWPARFRIAAEIATALNFLHQTKPEPLVHRDLKPANILLDKNYVSKISDVGLCRLVPPSIADTVTQYHMTAAAGTFCYIDPEYQQTGMLGTKSDIYSLGVMLLQIITAKPAMGLTYQVENAIEMEQFEEILDPTVKDWPVEEALSFAKLALQCCELRKRDRPDLDSQILPELERLRDLGSRFMSNKQLDYMHS